jgi:hypothetical protein
MLLGSLVVRPPGLGANLRHRLGIWAYAVVIPVYLAYTWWTAAIADRGAGDRAVCSAGAGRRWALRLALARGAPHRLAGRRNRASAARPRPRSQLAPRAERRSRPREELVAARSRREG